jgi:hypothetical protein
MHNAAPFTGVTYWPSGGNPDLVRFLKVRGAKMDLTMGKVDKLDLKT